MIRFTEHVKARLEERDISEQHVLEALKNPELILPARSGRKMAIKKIGERYLKVVFIETQDGIIVITAHWMSKMRGVSKV